MKIPKQAYTPEFKELPIGRFQGMPLKYRPSIPDFDPGGAQNAPSRN